MSEFSDKALLPAGMCDVLPPDAEVEAKATESLIAFFSGLGYQRVKPPLIEFEESLLTGSGAAMNAQTFRLMDPISQKMMGVRADMTLQVARIATTRMPHYQRPLRLCYSGQVLRVLGSQMRPERQFGQVGTELIGTDNPAADAEIIVMAADAIKNLGIDSLTVDLGLPTLVPAVLSGLQLDSESETTLRLALDRKDAAAVEGLSSELGRDRTDLLLAMLASTGPAKSAMEALLDLSFSSEASVERDKLSLVIDRIKMAAPDLPLTIDPVESRGLEYHTGVTFTFFATGVRGELGSGGRYITGGDEHGTGMTLFMDTIMRALPQGQADSRIYLPPGISNSDAKRLRDEGWITINGFDTGADDASEAKRMDCGYLFTNGETRKL